MEGDFLVPPPAKNATPAEWARWLEAEKRAEVVAKRQRTMSFEHGDFSEAFDGQFLAFDGDWENDEGELVVGVSANQEADIEAHTHLMADIRERRRETNAARRKAKRARKREAKRARMNRRA